ncbi:MAG: response regulator transcription factor [Bacteroidetes bacterium]|nr:response regulator transcription factor [Bacteroidota bacterium]
MIQVAIFEDNAQLRESLKELINTSEGFKVVGVFPNCNNIVKDCEQLKPHVVLLDIDMPGIKGIEGLKNLRISGNTDVKVLMLTVFDDNKSIFDAIQYGANGYILKKTAPAKLLEHINDAYLGGSPMTSSVATQVLKMFSEIHNRGNDNYNLTSREREVLEYLVKGYSYKMIASDMFIAIDTVRSHIKKIYEKLHVNSKSEAVAKAFQDKIV